MVGNHYYHNRLLAVGRVGKYADRRRGSAYCRSRGHHPTRSAQTYRNHRGIHSYGAQCDVPPRTAVLVMNKMLGLNTWIIYSMVQCPSLRITGPMLWMISSTSMKILTTPPPPGRPNFSASIHALGCLPLN